MRGEPVAPLAGARAAEAIVPAFEATIAIPGGRPPGDFRRRGIEMSLIRSRGCPPSRVKALVPRRASDGV